jgi:hypothetical protein
MKRDEPIKPGAVVVTVPMTVQTIEDQIATCIYFPRTLEQELAGETEPDIRTTRLHVRDLRWAPIERREELTERTLIERLHKEPNRTRSLCGFIVSPEDGARAFGALVLAGVIRVVDGAQPYYPQARLDVERLRVWAARKRGAR